MSDSFASPWTVACQAPLSMGSSRQQYWSGLPFPSPEWVTSQGADRLSQGGSHTHSHPTQPGRVLSPPVSPGSTPLSPKPHLHQTAAFTLGAHKQPCGEAGDLGREEATVPLYPPADTQGQTGSEEGPLSLPCPPTLVLGTRTAAICRSFWLPLCSSKVSW